MISFFSYLFGLQFLNKKKKINILCVQHTVYTYPDTCFDNTVESVGVLMSSATVFPMVRKTTC